ncbi:DUF6233 domain-containing protein [Streptomyces sp. NPDC012935]|uniref:DUF6233 domain-containing protein n=1 Tax=Streptomyces sp. NPDC012935 TaxID=3364857 RepID=UPI0036C5935E
MFDDLPPDLDRLHTLRVWHALWLQRIDHKIAALQKRQAEEEHARRTRPRPPEWIVELGIGDGRPPIEIHAGDCHMAGHRRRAVSREEARRLLAAGLRACIHCQPDNRLHILDLATRAVCGTTRPPAPSGEPFCGRRDGYVSPRTGKCDDNSPARDHRAGPVRTVLPR